MGTLGEAVEINVKMHKQGTRISASIAGPTVYAIILVVIVDPKLMAIEMQPQKIIVWEAVYEIYLQLTSDSSSVSNIV